MKKIFTHLFALFLFSFLTTSAWAQTTLENGCVYHFQNGHFTGRAIAAVDGNLAAVNATATDQADIKQLWYATQSGDNWIFRNLYNGRYLSQTGRNNWGLTDTYTAASNVFTYIVAGGTKNTIRSTAVSDGNGYMHLGTEGQTDVAGWGSASGGTQWVVTKKDYSADAITELLATAVSTFPNAAAFQAQLDAIFEDAACTKLNSTYTAMTEEQILADENYKALSTPLRDMVLKVKGNDWAEDNADATKHEGGLDWETKYAKKFRVQMYEPYSIAGDITAWLGINAHANNDNPTGIYVPEPGYVYVMVEGTVKDGASLRLVRAGSNHRIGNATTAGYALTTGLNVINIKEVTDGGDHLYICYNVDTYNPNGATHAEKFPRKLSEFAPLKIHIEGGAINGFYNACGDFRATTDAENLWKTYTGANVDADTDWEYMETRANLSIIPILGHREILLLQLEDEQGGPGLRSLFPNSINCPSTPYSYAETWADYGMGCNPSTGKINIVMEACDRIFYSQLATMGLVSNSQMERMNGLYPRWTKEGTPAEMYDYENESNIDNKTYLEFCQDIDYSEYFNHHGIILGTSSGYPYGAGDHVGYPIGGFSDVYNLPNTAGSTWGPAHEIGHQHQGLFTLNGLTEVTNNLFSNISLWYKGMSTSRYNGSDGSLESVLNAFNTNGSDIYTNNIWALTHLYYRLWLYYHLAGNNTQFYPRLFELLRNEQMQKGYNVSGDVSTLHFYKLACQAAGEDLTEFFRAHGYFSVMEDRFVGDYNNSIYNVSQAMIDEAIAEVKAMRDAEGNPLKENLSIIFINDDDETATYLQHDGETAREIYGETTPNSDFGSVTDFIAGNVPVETTYTATSSDNGTITMSGGTGGVGFLILNEKGEIISFSNKATFALSDKAMEAIVSGNATIKAVDSQSNVVEAEVNLTAMQKGVLGALISKAQSIVDKVDGTYTKIGYFKPAAVTDLASALEYAKEVYAGLSDYEAAYDLLYAEYTKVLENKDAKIPFNPSLTYIITNKAYPSETMWVNGSGVVRSEGGVNQTSKDARWKFVETSTPGVYNICTLNNKYIPAVQRSVSMNATSDKADNDALYTLEEVADGVWAIKLSPAADYRNLHSSWNNVVGWETGADASRWYLTAVAADPLIADLVDLEVYINKTEALLDEVVGALTYTKGTQLSLQTTTQGSAGYLWSNAPETREGNIANLVDGASNNYFHTDWSSEPPSGSHYLAVYLGEDNDLSNFTFSHTTRPYVINDFPKSVDVYGSDDNVTYKYIGSASGMPQSAGTAWEFNGVMQSSYKYLRFNYHASRGYWHMAEFDITPITGFTATVNDVYSGTVSVDAVTAAMNALHNGKRTANSISPTSGDIDAKLQALQSAYETLYTQYEATIDARKATLAQLAAETETLIDQAGKVQLALETPIALSASNLYCNAPYTASNNNDYSADYVSKLTDSSVTTYLHTDYSGSIATPHYLRVYLGENSTAKRFKFNYTTRDNGNNCPTTIVIEGCNEENGTYKEITTLTTADGLPNPGFVNAGGVAEAFESEIITMSAAYKYVRFKVTGVEGSGANFFVISTFGFSTVEEVVTVYDSYKNNVNDDLLLSSVLTTNSSKAMSVNALVTSVPLLDAQIADQQAAKAALEEAMGIVVDKTELSELIEDMETLLGEVADKTTAKTSIALQVEYENAPFYIWSNAPASDCNSYSDKVQGLIDENNDGTANTGTFFGTVWQGGAVPNYSHYITVDLGTEIALSELSIDYTTRNSTHANQRPTSIKVLGSNDKEGEYAEITTLSEDMPVGQNQKWEMTSSVALNSYYRYIRFAVATEMGYFNMSDFNLYAHSALKANDNYSTSDITTAQLFAMNAALLDGIDARDNFVTEENYNAAFTVLQEQYDELLDIKNANVSDRNSLANLINETNTPVAEVAKIDETEAKIALQCYDESAPYYIYCNAPGATNNWGGDNSGVVALLDYDDGGQPINATHLHTTYVGDSYDDELDHYLRVDMGENKALAAFKFAYIPRMGNTNNSPKVMLVEGSNDCENFEEITTLTNMAPTYQSSEITNGKAYRYIRFMVKKTHNNDKYNGHPFFVLSHFEMTACKTIEVNAEYVSPNLPLSVVVAASNELVDGTTVNDQFYVTQDLYDSTVAELQAAKNALETGMNLKNMPVILTTDVNNPVLYKIRINRGDTKLLQYDNGTKMVAVDDDKLGNKYQAWYFMQGTDETGYDDILILPYWNEGSANTALRLGAASTSNAAAAVWAVESGDASKNLQNWYITVDAGNTAEGWWNIRPQGKDNYFSNYLGIGNKMGFWNSSSDDGSEFQFVLDETDYSLSEAYYDLFKYHTACGGEKTAGTKVGMYAETADYNTKYAEVKTMLEERKSTDDEYIAAKEELERLFNALVLNMPVEGAMYRIKSAYTGQYSDGKLIYVGSDNKPYFDATADNSLSVWQFEIVDGGYYLKSLHTQSYIKSAGWGAHVELNDTVDNAAKVSIEALDYYYGIVKINVDKGHPLHAQENGSKLVGYSGGLYSASAWYIEEVEDVATIKHDVTMKTEFSSVTLGYNATVPDGVEAYNAKGISGGYVELEMIAEGGGVIPANTPVILYIPEFSEAVTKTFKYEEENSAEKPAESLLGGSLYTKYVKCDGDADYYKLMIKNDEAKMYLMYKEFNAEGNYGENDVLKGTDNGGHIKCSANKIYMRIPGANGMAMFGMRFATPGTTGIDELKGENAEGKEIYDLTGRKLSEITEPGFYIVNGKKMYVK